MMIKIEPRFIRKIEDLRKQCLRTSTLTANYFYLEILDETILTFKAGYRFMPVIGASVVVESCLLEQKRRDSKWTTLEERFKVNMTLGDLIKEYRDNPIIPIVELLDREELDQTKKKYKFAHMRNKFAHGDLLQPAFNQTEFYRLLPELEELREKYNVDIDDILTIRWDLPGYVQITKCLNFLIKWQYHLSDRNR